MSILKLKCADSENNRIKFFSKHIIISHFTDIMNASTCSSSIVYLITLHSVFILLNSSRPIATTSISDQKHSLQVRIYEYCNTIWSPIQVTSTPILVYKRSWLEKLNCGFFHSFHCEKTPQNNFSSQNISVENNYLSQNDDNIIFYILKYFIPELSYQKCKFIHG